MDIKLNNEELIVYEALLSKIEYTRKKKLWEWINDLLKTALIKLSKWIDLDDEEFKKVLSSLEYSFKKDFLSKDAEEINNFKGSNKKEIAMVTLFKYI